MQKFKWSLYKTLEFLNSRRPDLEIRASFVSQLADFEQKLIAQNRGPQTANWNEVADKDVALNKDKFYPDEELILRNTFLNAQLGFSRSFDRSKPEPTHIPPVQPEDFAQSRLRWIDNNEDNKDKLRTNNSEDDLVCKHKIEEITSHKILHNKKPIIKVVSKKKEELASKSVTNQANRSMERSFHKTEKQNQHYKSLKNKGEPLLINDLDIMDDDEESDLRVSQTQDQDTGKERIIEQFNTGNNTQKFFVPKKQDLLNNTEPIDLKHKKLQRPVNDAFMKNVNITKNSNPQQKFIVRKSNEKANNTAGIAKDTGKIIVTKINQDQDDSQSANQKDVIVRRIRKKNENSKASNSVHVGFGHK